tara:strand:- start:889 stop:1407 length:519 start_codon:yes stop_codon:yes gene_type:complete
MASIVSVEQIKGLAGGSTPNTITIPSGQTLTAPGHIIQTVSYNINQGTTTFTNSTSLSLTSGQTLTIGAGTITPKHSTSKILVMGHNVFHQSGSGYVYFRIMRDSTIIQTPGNAVGYQQPNGSRIEIPYFQYDSPGTTSAITYSHRIDYHGGTVNMMSNYGSCSLTLMEIAQ